MAINCRKWLKINKRKRPQFVKNVQDGQKLSKMARNCHKWPKKLSKMAKIKPKLSRFCPGKKEPEVHQLTP